MFTLMVWLIVGYILLRMVSFVARDVKNGLQGAATWAKEGNERYRRAHPEVFCAGCLEPHGNGMYCQHCGALRLKTC